MLSRNTIGLISSERKLQNQIASLVMYIRVMYSASIVDRETISYCFDDHKTVAPFKINIS